MKVQKEEVANQISLFLLVSDTKKRGMEGELSQVIQVRETQHIQPSEVANPPSKQLIQSLYDPSTSATDQSALQLRLQEVPASLATTDSTIAKSSSCPGSIFSRRVVNHWPAPFARRPFR